MCIIFLKYVIEHLKKYTCVPESITDPILWGILISLAFQRLKLYNDKFLYLPHIIKTGPLLWTHIYFV